MRRNGGTGPRRGFGGALGVLFPLLVALFCAFAPLAAEEARPVLMELRVAQYGGESLALTLLGSALPDPIPIAPAGDAALSLLWPNVAAGKDLPSNKDCDWPLLRRVEFRADKRGLRMDLFGPESLAVAQVRGRTGGTERELVVSVPRTVKGPSPTPIPPLPPRYDPLSRIEPVTLVAREIGLRDALRQLADVMGMNLVVDASVPEATISGLSLRAMPLGEAFTYLFRMYDLTYAVTGKTLIVGKAEALTKLLGKETTRAYRIAYADPSTLPGLLAGFVSFSRPPVVDVRQRTVYLSGNPETLKRAEEVLAKLDAPGRQVMLEARIIEIADGNQDQLSTAIQGAYNHWWFSFTGNGFGTGYTRINRPDIFQNTDTDSPIMPDIDPADLAESTGLKMLDASIQALVSKNKAKLLATPSVITLDGQKATIKLTTQTKYISGYDQAGNPTYGDIEGGPQLVFTPTIGRDGMVTVELNIETGTVTFLTNSNGTQYPQKSSRSVTTRVTVRDGELFVVGGLYGRDKTKTVKGIPIIMDIPILGSLFKSTSTTETTTEVVMVVVPRIVNMLNSAPESGTLFEEPVVSYPLPPQALLMPRPTAAPANVPGLSGAQLPGGGRGGGASTPVAPAPTPRTSAVPTPAPAPVGGIPTPIPTPGYGHGSAAPGKRPVYVPTSADSGGVSPTPVPTSPPGSYTPYAP